MLGRRSRSHAPRWQALKYVSHRATPAAAATVAAPRLQLERPCNSESCVRLRPAQPKETHGGAAFDGQAVLLMYRILLAMTSACTRVYFELILHYTSFRLVFHLRFELCCSGLDLRLELRCARLGFALQVRCP